MENADVRPYNLTYNNIVWDIPAEEIAKEFHRRWGSRAIPFVLGIPFDEYDAMSSSEAIATITAFVARGYKQPRYRNVLELLKIEPKVEIPSFILEDDAKAWLEEKYNCKIKSYDVERSLKTKRVVELFGGIVDYVVSNKGTNEKIAILLNLGFEMDELACFGISRADLKKYKEGLYDSLT